MPIRRYKSSSGRVGWQIDVSFTVDGKTRRRSKIIYGPRQIALAMETALLQRLLNPDESGHSVTVNQILDAFLKYSKREKASWKADEYRAKEIKEIFGNRPAASIRPSEIEDYLYSLIKRGKKPATANRARSLLSASYNRAIRDGRLTANPVNAVRRLQENNLRQVEIPDDDLFQIALNAETYIQWFIAWARLTGLRCGEVLNLDREHVRFQDNPPVVVPPGKSATKRQGVVPICDLLVKYAQDAPGGPLLRYPYRSRGKLSGNRRLGYPIAGWRGAIRRAGLESRNYRIHDLRRTFENHLLRAGIRPDVVDFVSGHHSAAHPTVRQRYLVTNRADLRAVRDALNDSKIHRQLSRLLTWKSPL